MSAEAFFDAARALKREMSGEGLSQADVDVLNAVILSWGHAPHLSPTALTDAGAFFASVRQSFGALEQSQVNGFQRLLQAYGEARWPISWAAYGLATGWRETAKQMQPVEEAYYLGSKAEAYRKTLRYYPWTGRGDVQCTWEDNYKQADKELGLNGALLANPALALDPIISAKIMVLGMSQGWFTSRKMADYLPSFGPADIHQFANARHIINGQDAAVEIAENAMKFQTALTAGRWA